MKKTKFLMAVATVAIVSLTACSNDESANSATDGLTAAKFTANIGAKTRAAETTWAAGDKIGITGTSGSKAYSNVAYQTAVSGEKGSFTVETEGEEIYYQDDAAVDFTAYYPWNSSTTITADTYVQASQSSFDFLYATGTGSKAQPDVALKFSHKMAKLVLTIVPGKGVSYDEVKAAVLSLAGFKNNGTFNGLTGEAAATGENSGAWTFAGSETATNNAPFTLDDTKESVAYSLILFPQELSADMTFAATNTQTFTAGIGLEEANAAAGDTDAKNAFVAGRQYNITVTMSKTSLTVTNCTIAPWTAVEGADVEAM